jgi:hypothetical protein
VDLADDEKDEYDEQRDCGHDPQRLEDIVGKAQALVLERGAFGSGLSWSLIHN